MSKDVVPVGTQFTALKDFQCKELQSHYVKGLSYTVRVDVLGKLVATWLKEGKVQLGAPTSKIGGRG